MQPTEPASPPPSADDPGSTAPSPPLVRIPPSIGGTGLAAVSGLLLGRHLTEAWVFGAPLPLGAWLVPVVLMIFVFVLVQFTLMARERVGMRVDPRSVRRQWWVVGGAALVGAGLGVAFPFVQGH